MLKIKNRAEDTLKTSMTDSQETMEVNNIANFPTTFPFRLTIEDEIVEVLSESSSEYTITRGMENTIPASHNSGVDVTLNITSGVIEEIQNVAAKISIIAGDTLCNSNNTEQTTTSTLAVKLKETVLGAYAENLRITVAGKVAALGQWGMVSLYVNGVYKTTIGSPDNTSSEVYSKDVSGPFYSGDLLQIYAKVGQTPWQVWVSSFRIYASFSVTHFGDYELSTPLEISMTPDLNCTNQDP